MSYSIEFEFRGLAVTAEIEEYDRGTYMQPPEGGEAESINWDVDDIDEVLEEMGIESESVEQIVRACFKYTGKLPLALERRINREWDIEEAAAEYFRDYDYDG